LLPLGPLVILGRHVDQAVNAAGGIIQGYRHRVALIAVFLPVVQVLKDLVIDQVCHAAA
jgi:hypothetical protein